VQRSVNVLTVDAVIRITKESLGVDQVVPWLVMACVLVMLIEHLLSTDGQDHANTSANNDGDNRVSQMIVSHDSDVFLGSDNKCHVIRHHECSSTTTNVMQLL
jgi:hypothetical protein